MRISDILANGKVDIVALLVYVNEKYPDKYLVKYKVSENDDFVILVFKDEVGILTYWDRDIYTLIEVYANNELLVRIGSEKSYIIC